MGKKKNEEGFAGDGHVDAAGTEHLTDAQKAMADAAAAMDSVRMTDGRTVDFVGKKRLIKTAIIGENSAQVRFDFRNGETRLFNIPANMLLKLAAHGAEQKIGDATAGLTDIDDAVVAVDELMDQLTQGVWTQRKEGGQNTFAGMSILAKALARHNPAKSALEIKTFLKSRTHAERMALRAHPSIKPHVEALEALQKPKKGAVVVDADSVLSGL